ncbi:hypothetical protein ACIHFD_36170 [Nonomuraea sp. NPDC051941]|uniref:hypothetical protein n=1 Tax=Nonomuraea sp. NPDC051941 TaxID=3364373 RepID=UPI0037C827D8
MIMECVLIIVDTPDWRASEAALRTAFKDSAVTSDHLEHIFLQVQEGLFTLVLYLSAAGQKEAHAKAEQLCRRALAAVVPQHVVWMIRLTTVL